MDSSGQLFFYDDALVALLARFAGGSVAVALLQSRSRMGGPGLRDAVNAARVAATVNAVEAARNAAAVKRSRAAEEVARTAAAEAARTAYAASLEVGRTCAVLMWRVRLRKRRESGRLRGADGQELDTDSEWEWTSPSPESGSGDN